MALWAASAIAVGFLNPPMDRATFEVLALGFPPILIEDSKCEFEDKYQPVTLDLPGKKVYGSLCFKAHKSDDGKMLIPYKDHTSKGMVWMDSSTSANVRLYADSVSANFRPTPEQLEALNSMLFKGRIVDLLKHFGYALGGAALIYLAATIIGWIARGFIRNPA
ncbi:hypothetical protein CTS44_25636 [Comamonas thiooxydans]|nr:hypothetical protein CTS44_25636 [Comamonas thiooxydans]